MRVTIILCCVFLLGACTIMQPKEERIDTIPPLDDPCICCADCDDGYQG